MTENEWFIETEANMKNLKRLIEDFHPANQVRASNYMKITAPNAEHAAEVVRNNIRRNFEGNPVAIFEEAIKNKDYSSASKILNDTWFGVPESTDCWNLIGFRECVVLLENSADDSVMAKGE